MTEKNLILPHCVTFSNNALIYIFRNFYFLQNRFDLIAGWTNPKNAPVKKCIWEGEKLRKSRIFFMKLTVIVAKVVSTNDYLIQTNQPNEFYALEFFAHCKTFCKSNFSCMFMDEIRITSCQNLFSIVLVAAISRKNYYWVAS